MGQYFKNSPPSKMTDCWLTFGYACGLFIGGLLGLNHDDPNISMGMGLLNAVGATYGAYLIHENPNDIKVTAFIATFNAIFLGLKAAKSQDTNPFCSFESQKDCIKCS